MKQVDYQDADGRWWRVMVPDDCPEDKYGAGIPVGPPSLADLGLPLEVEIRLHNQLHARGLLMAKQILARPKDLFGALQATFRTDMQRIQTIYVKAEGG